MHIIITTVTTSTFALVSDNDPLGLGNGILVW